MYGIPDKERAAVGVLFLPHPSEFGLAVRVNVAASQYFVKVSANAERPHLPPKHSEFGCRKQRMAVSHGTERTKRIPGTGIQSGMDAVCKVQFHPLVCELFKRRLIKIKSGAAVILLNGKAEYLAVPFLGTERRFAVPDKQCINAVKARLHVVVQSTVEVPDQIGIGHIFPSQSFLKQEKPECFHPG